MIHSLFMIITLANFKGGVGKTTTAIHLAGYLATKDKTLLVDGDQNQSSLDWAAAEKFNFSVISPDELSQEAKNFSHIIIDTEARPKRDDLNSLTKFSDLLIIPTTPDALSIKATQKIVSEMKIKGTDFRILITMSPPPPSHDGTDAAKFLTKSGLPVFKNHIRRYTVYKKASLLGCLVKDVKNPYAKSAWSDYQKLGKEILG